jgi:argininosuccinate synthase|tara:strand:+ start:1536 stop:2084 length:549 start_codon:yes stop_codon:yes gene_type:complete
MKVARVTQKLASAAQRRAASSSAAPVKFNKTEFRKPDPSKQKIVLAYSGGLDTSAQLSWLAKEKGYEVCAYIADLGQEDVVTQEAKDAIRDKAEASGAYSFYCEDLSEEFVTDYAFTALKTGALYEGRYLLGTSIARPCIGKRQVEICWEEGARAISHGSTGKGNDQVRFEMAYLGMDPTIK